MSASITQLEIYKESNFPNEDHESCKFFGLAVLKIPTKITKTVDISDIQ